MDSASFTLSSPLAVVKVLCISTCVSRMLCQVLKMRCSSGWDTACWVFSGSMNTLHTRRSVRTNLTSDACHARAASAACASVQRESSPPRPLSWEMSRAPLHCRLRRLHATHRQVIQHLLPASPSSCHASCLPPRCSGCSRKHGLWCPCSCCWPERALECRCDTPNSRALLRSFTRSKLRGGKCQLRRVSRLVGIGRLGMVSVPLRWRGVVAPAAWLTQGRHVQHPAIAQRAGRGCAAPGAAVAVSGPGPQISRASCGKLQLNCTAARCRAQVVFGAQGNEHRSKRAN